MHLLVFDDEAGASIRIFHWVAGGDDILPGWSEDAQGKLFVLYPHCSKQGAGSFFSGGKGPLSRLLGERWCKRTPQGKCQQNGHCKSNEAFAFKLCKNRNPVQHGIPLYSCIFAKLYTRVCAITYV